MSWDGSNRAPRGEAVYVKLHSQLTSLPPLTSVMARSEKALPEVGETSKILKAKLRIVERSFPETQEEADWDEHLRHSTCQKAANARACKTTQHQDTVL